MTGNPPSEANGDIKSQTVSLERHPALYLELDTAKGRGVFSHQPILKGTIIDTSPVLILTPEENTQHVEHTTLYHYTYNWPLTTPSGQITKTQALVLGLGSMFNHSTLHQNVGWTRDLDCQVVIYRALRDIEAGEELCISYGAPGTLTFKNADADDHSEEDEAEVLARIDVDELTNESST